MPLNSMETRESVYRDGTVSWSVGPSAISVEFLFDCSIKEELHYFPLVLSMSKYVVLFCSLAGGQSVGGGLSFIETGRLLSD